MKIAVCAKTTGMDAQADDRFGRAEYYVIFDTETRSSETFENPAKGEPAGAGGSAVRFISQQGAQAVLAPELGPKAVDALRAFELAAFRYTEKKTVRETIADFLDGKLAKADVSTTKSKHGLRKA